MGFSATNFISSEHLQRHAKQLISDLNIVLDQEEAFWFQKSRMDWIIDGDRNTRFYHNSALSRRIKNHIRFLKIQGVWTDNPTSLTNHIIDYFSSLFLQGFSGRRGDFDRNR